MSMPLISRRHFLTLPAFLAFSAWPRAFAEGQVTRGAYVADVGILYDMFTLHL